MLMEIQPYIKNLDLPAPPQLSKYLVKESTFVGSLGDQFKSNRVLSCKSEHLEATSLTFLCG